jgi:hypothetical protein
VLAVLIGLTAYTVVSVVLGLIFPHMAEETVLTYISVIFSIIIGEVIRRVERWKNEDPKFVKNLLNLYYIWKSETLLKENWPYDIDKKTFVDNFSFKQGGILSEKLQLEKAQNCLDFIKSDDFKVPVVCVGYYGMGKTTISKMLFTRLDVNTRFPIFISLSHKPLRRFLKNEDLNAQIVEEITSYENRNVSKSDRESLPRRVDKLARAGQILLVFDGIDEAICDSREDDLTQFIRFIFESKFPAFLTCRMEYRPFFDACHAVSPKDDSAKCIELCEWNDAQWKTYVDGLSNKHPSKGATITAFYNKIKNGTYGTLPGRPLFLKMLSDLEVNNKTEIVIEPDLSSNLAEIYYKFLKWKIQDDYDRKGGTKDLDRDLFEKDCFRLLKEIAVLEYTSPQGSVTLDAIRKIFANEKFIHLKEDYVIETLLRSTLFAVLRRTPNDSFSFSHKSFMEYLVAFKLAECILSAGGNQPKPHCDDTWNIFQTHEVSSHFLCEVERIALTNKLGERTDELLSSAFKEVVITEGIQLYSERFQEVLYYTGKLKLKSKELRDLLLLIIKNKDQYHPIYYRAAHIALSRIMGDNYCENYVLELFGDPIGFEKNREIQLRYYGKTTIRTVLKEDIDEYVSERNKSSIISLKILSYFTALTPMTDELSTLLVYLQQIRESAVRLGDNNIQLICDKISAWLENKTAA